MSVETYKPFIKSLSSHEGRFNLKEEMKNKTIESTYYNSLKGIDKFDAVVLRAWMYETSNASDVSGQYIAARIRPLKVHGFLLPPPCSKGYSVEDQQCIVSLHPLAISQSPVGSGGGLEVNRGDIVSCFWTHKSPQSQGKMSGLRFSFGKVHKNPGNFNIDCLEAIPVTFGIGQQLGTGNAGTVSQKAFVGNMGEIRVTQAEIDYLKSKKGKKGNDYFEDDNEIRRAYIGRQKKGHTATTLGWGNRYDGLIQKYAAKYGLDPILWKCLIWSESRFNKDIGSPVGAQGLGQIMPGTARGIARDLGWPRSKYVWNNPEHNLEFSAYYLAKRLKGMTAPPENRKGSSGNIKSDVWARMKNGETREQIYQTPRIDLVFASYNAGLGAVDKYKGVPPFKETKIYVPKIKKRYFWLKKYGAWTPLPTPQGN